MRIFHIEIFDNKRTVSLPQSCIDTCHKPEIMTIKLYNMTMTFCTPKVYINSSLCSLCTWHFFHIFQYKPCHLIRLCFYELFLIIVHERLYYYDRPTHFLDFMPPLWVLKADVTSGFIHCEINKDNTTSMFNTEVEERKKFYRHCNGACQNSEI